MTLIRAFIDGQASLDPRHWWRMWWRMWWPPDDRDDQQEEP